MNTLNEPSARIMVRQLVRSFVDATEVEESSNEWVVRALKLQETLGRVLGVTPTAADIEELVTTFEELDSVEYGTHPELVTNMSGTINNMPEVTDYLMGRIDRETTALLRNAGFGMVAA